MSNNTGNDLGISLLQHVPTPGDVDAGIKRLEQAARLCAEQGSSLLVTPECGITGYDMSVNDARSAAFESEGCVAERIAAIARRHSLAILYGYIETESQQLFNSVQLIDDNGNAILHYRKTHLWGDLDRELFNAGNSLAPVVNYRGWQLSTLICYDVEFPEAVRALALEGAQLILIPTALMQPFRFIAEQVIRVRAAENQLYIAYANLVGQERRTLYEGCSIIATPQGDVLVQAPHDKAALMHTTLKLETLSQIRRAVPYHDDRRPELYGSLVKPVPHVSNQA